jgi:hypothetical protein
MSILRAGDQECVRPCNFGLIGGNRHGTMMLEIRVKEG